MWICDFHCEEPECVEPCFFIVRNPNAEIRGQENPNAEIRVFHCEEPEYVDTWFHCVGADVTSLKTMIDCGMDIDTTSVRPF